MLAKFVILVIYESHIFVSFFENLVSKWNPDSPEIPDLFYERLQRFNYSDDNERAMAIRYRDSELPFKVYNVPELNFVAKKWSDQYLHKVMSKEPIHVEKSETNHFMYWNSKLKTENFQPPTKVRSQ